MNNMRKINLRTGDWLVDFLGLPPEEWSTPWLAFIGPDLLPDFETGADVGTTGPVRTSGVL